MSNRQSSRISNTGGATMMNRMSKTAAYSAARAAKGARASWRAAKDIAGGPPGHSAI